MPLPEAPEPKYYATPLQRQVWLRLQQALLQAPRPAQKLVHIHSGAEELGRVYSADLMLQASML